MSAAAPDDDDKTVSGAPAPGAARATGVRDDVETGIHAERRRGRAASAPQPGHTLPLGTRLRDFEITGLIGEGGFGIVYLAWDHSLQRKVAIKEYMPASMAARVNGSSAIVVKSERHLDTFRAGLKSFVNEARLLARFDHPSLVKVYRFWEENGTAYMAMPHYAGPTLKAALAALGRPPSEDELRAWLRPLLDALAAMHAAQCYHRDIAPDNILLTPRGPLLLDFGAARRVIGDMTHAITVVLKPGYAPVEQYGEVATMTQGAWTDLYALACVVYYAIVGKTPTSSVERLMDDRLEPLAASAAGRYGDAFLRAVDAALAVRPADRPQSVREFRALLDGDLSARAASTDRDAGTVASPSVSAPRTPAIASDLLPREARPAARGAPAPATPASPRRRSAALLIGAATVAVLLAAALFAWLQPRGGPLPSASPAASAMAPSLAAPATAPSLTTRPAATATPVTTSTSTSTSTRAPAPTPAQASVDREPASAAAAPSTRRPQPSREAAPPRSEDRATGSPRPATPRTSTVSARCADIVQKASLEPLTAEEAGYLKNECR